ncbi:MAG TPA: aminotransferase class I/II-fold pyridoxal phosphate-dependent enzyme [Kofleriaceae bacterium]|nr:aminotransferase class I/II-fold pyridoxal phosphate-dependent enzyme [Kofleriaceae bacterium]
MNLPVVEPAATTPYAENTRAVHAPRPDLSAVRPLGLPTYRTAAFEFERTQDYADVLGDRKPGYSYSRIDNPTADAFALGLASLEAHGLDRPVAAQVFASGMAAISTVFLSLCRSGAHVVAPAAVYGGTYGLLTHILGRFGVDASFVDMTDLETVRGAIRDNTALVWAETIANPTTAITDIAGVAALCRDAGVPFAIDSTFAPAPVCRPLRWGADLVVHSATKYLGGHSDVLAGALVTAKLDDAWAALAQLRHDEGAVLGPVEAWLLLRGMRTLYARVERQSQTAFVLATKLAARGVAVDYPGLQNHPGHAVAARQMQGGFGGMLSIRVADPLAVVGKLRVWVPATSLGGVESLIEHRASVEGPTSPTPKSLLRLSVGLEHPDDLWSDLVQALA